MSTLTGKFAGISDMRAMWVGWAIDPIALQAVSPTGERFSPTKFSAMFEGPAFQMTLDGKDTPNAWRAFVFNECYRFPRVKSTNVR